MHVFFSASFGRLNQHTFRQGQVHHDTTTHISMTSNRGRGSVRSRLDSISNNMLIDANDAEPEEVNSAQNQVSALDTYIPCR